MQPDSSFTSKIAIKIFGTNIVKSDEVFMTSLLYISVDHEMNCDQLLNSAFEYYQAGNLLRAEQVCREILKIQPDKVEIYNNLGLILIRQGHLDEAITCYQTAIQLNPNFFDAFYNLGAIFQDKMQLDDAIKYYSRALSLDPNIADVHYNLGIALRDTLRIDEAITCYRNALKLNPNLAAAHFNLSLALLLSGNYTEGWKEYEWRWKVESLSQRRNFLQPQWNRSDIRGKTVLLYTEDGFGDTIQFIRYVPLVAQRAAKVIVECQKELVSLAQNIEGVYRVVSQGERLPDIDVYCSLLRLPYLFKTTIDTIPTGIPYIKPAPALIEKWRDKIAHDNSKLKIGLAWAGSPREGKLRHRSCPLEMFSVLSELDDIVFYSLQKGVPESGRTNLPDHFKFVDYMEEVADFSDTAALIENLDLVISVDTAVAHLAGALGKKVWTLVSFPPDWRWMLNCKNSPWYPTMQVFRQPSQGEWNVVIDSIFNELRVRLIGY
jgi:Tfp pilus assembly protein PilF